MASRVTRYALISVFDKTGIVDFAKKLTHLEYTIISTGGIRWSLPKDAPSGTRQAMIKMIVQYL